MAVTDVLLTLGVTVTLALLVSGRLEWAGVAAGLAASAKYPGVLLLVPLVVAGFGEWRRVGRAIALAAAAFLLTSPFVVLHAGAAWDDISRVQRLAQAGWLGFEDDPVTPLAFGERLWQTLGPLALVGLAGVAIAAWRHTRRDLVLLSFVAVYALSLLPARGALRPLRVAARPRPLRPRGSRSMARRSPRSWPRSCRCGGRSTTRAR